MAKASCFFSFPQDWIGEEIMIRGGAPAGGVVALAQELNWLLDGYDLSKWRPHSRLHYEWVA